MEWTKRSQSTIATDLPVEIATEILLRLPVKSLLRCKSVCRNWYDLIKSPDFIASHLTRFALNPNLNSISLLVTNYDSATKKHVMSLIFNDGFPYGPINLDFPFLNRRTNLCIWEYTAKEHFSVVGICNGLVCINFTPFGCPLILCNPLTGQFREIPKCKRLDDDWLDYDCYVKVKRVSFGFGVHPNSGDYKLIRIMLCSSPVQEVLIRADLYAMRTDSWREIAVDKVSAFFGEMNSFVKIGIPCASVVSCASAVLNGVFYWLARVMPTFEVTVMSFDMGDEVFRRISTQGPSYWNGDKTFRVTELKDKLALIIHTDDRCFDVWVLNEDQSSWTNQFKAGCFPRIERSVQFRRSSEITVVGGAKHGQLVVKEDHKNSGDLELFLYDPNTQETQDLYFGKVPYPSDVNLYSGTLLPVM